MTLEFNVLSVCGVGYTIHELTKFFHTVDSGVGGRVNDTETEGWMYSDETGSIEAILKLHF